MQQRPVNVISVMCDFCNKVARENGTNEKEARYMAIRYQGYMGEGGYDFCSEKCADKYFGNKNNNEKEPPAKNNNHIQTKQQKRKRTWRF